MARKGTKPKLTDEQRNERKQLQREKALGFAPKRVNKLLKVSRQVANLFKYPLEAEEKTKIMDAVTKAYLFIKTQAEGKQQEEFSF